MRGPGLGGTPGSRLLEEPPHPLLRGPPGGPRRLTARDCVEMLPRARTAAWLPQWTRPGAPGWTHTLARGSRGEAFKRRWLPGASVKNDTRMLCWRTRPSLVAPGRNGGLGRAPSGGSRARARVGRPRWLPPPSTGHVRPPVHMGRSVQTLRHGPILRTAMRGVTGGAAGRGAAECLCPDLPRGDGASTTATPLTRSLHQHRGLSPGGPRWDLRGPAGLRFPALTL